MSQQIKNILVTIAIILAVGGIAIGTGVVITNYRKKKQESEIQALLDIARQEGTLNQEGYDKLRKLIYLDSYSLPAPLLNAFNKIKPLLQSAGSGMRSGYAVSSMQYFTQIRDIMSTEPLSVQNQYHTVENLLAEAFKLNAASVSVQEKLNSANSKSIDWWGVVAEVLFPLPSSLLKQHSDIEYAFNRLTSGSPTEETKAFDKKLMGQSSDTLKLFSEAYKALSGGKDFFEIPKNIKA